MSALAEELPPVEDALLLQRLSELRSVLTDNVNTLLPDWRAKKFLLAKQLNLDKALAMVNSWASWWVNPLVPDTDVTPRDMYERVAMEDDINEALYRETTPQSYQGEDFNGNPIFWEKLGTSKRILFVLSSDAKHGY
jgi:hypothetical protein